MPRFIVIDAGGTARTIKRFVVIDAGGTARTIKRAFVIDAGGTARLFFQSETVQLSASYTVNASSFSPSNPTASFTVKSNGTLESFGSTFGVIGQGNWLTSVPPSNPAAYELFATQLSGPAITGSFGSWLPLSSDRSYSRLSTSTGTVNCVFQIQIRTAADGVVRGTSTVTLSLTKNP